MSSAAQRISSIPKPTHTPASSARKCALLGIVIAVLFTHASRLGGQSRGATDARADAIPQSSRFALTSPNLVTHGSVDPSHVLNTDGCHGGNESPILAWRHAPKGTRSFAVTLYDPDAPTGSGWWHWTVYNIPSAVTVLPRGAGAAGSTAAPAGSVEGPTDWEKPGYNGPCPPTGKPPHRYVFTVYALRVASLSVPRGATPAALGYLLHLNAIDTATLVARYGKERPFSRSTPK